VTKYYHKFGECRLRVRRGDHPAYALGHALRVRKSSYNDDEPYNYFKRQISRSHVLRAI
jgi:hypothetical protein